MHNLVYNSLQSCPKTVSNWFDQQFNDFSLKNLFEDAPTTWPHKHQLKTIPHVKTLFFSEGVGISVVEQLESHTNTHRLKGQRAVLNTVDGKSPAPVAIVDMALFTRFHTSQVVVWEFFHQQYFFLPSWLPPFSQLTQKGSQGRTDFVSKICLDQRYRTKPKIATFMAHEMQ